jgi:hypothetical protein
MVEPLRHRQTKGAATDMFDLTPPRHIPTLPSITEFPALVGNPARANALMVLLDGRALTAPEPRHGASVSPQSANGHLPRRLRRGYWRW